MSWQVVFGLLCILRGRSYAVVHVARQNRAMTDAVDLGIAPGYGEDNTGTPADNGRRSHETSDIVLIPSNQCEG